MIVTNVYSLLFYLVKGQKGVMQCTIEIMETVFRHLLILDVRRWKVQGKFK